MQCSHLIFHDDEHVRLQLYPLTLTRPICDLRIGITTIKEKWLHYFNLPFSYGTVKYLSDKFTLPKTLENGLIINGHILPDANIVKAIENLQANESLWHNGEFIAKKNTTASFNLKDGKKIEYHSGLKSITRPYHIFGQNEEQIVLDVERFKPTTKWVKPSATNTLLGDQVFMEEGADVECAVLDSRQGPIYIGKNATIMPNSAVIGPFAMCANAFIKIGGKMYSGTTLGPYAKFAGEVNNVVAQGYCNKGHDGYLGNAVLGEWCNLGAGTTASNLSNNYDSVKLWDYSAQGYEKAPLQFCGLIMGDHSKCAINTSFNTATVVGVAANIFGAGFPKKYIPSFTWGGVSIHRTFTLEKVNGMAATMMKRKNIEFTEADKAILKHIYEYSDSFRK